MGGIIKRAVIDPTGMYRYSLTRIWNPDLQRVLFIMLNPSTADNYLDDPTIRRCIGFSKSWGYGSLEVVNLFAFRATNPDELKKCVDPIGPDNDNYINRAADQAKQIVMAWGTKGSLFQRDKEVMKVLSRYITLCIAVTKDGHPKHPLYIASDSQPVLF